ncbi:MAG TPA: hypothetical protein EYP10_11430, partial [Armatimonadetes bacterium]|nr:hypothetical protein [Armatimonadota bacterium]
MAKASHVYKLAKDIRRYHELGLTTYDAESECNWVPCGLGYWMAAHFMWNPELDDDELVADFCKKAFKRAAKPMRRIIDRWARGERFSQRTLALSLRDLQEAYRLESDEKVRKRLDHFAMYLHWLRLWHRYHHLSQRTEFGKLIVEPKLVIEAAREWTIFTRRVYDTGIVHVYPILFTGWFKRRLNSLFQIRGLNPKMVNSWKHERTDIPTPDEVKRLLANDAMAFANVHAVEIAWKQYSTDLVPLVKYIPQINEKYATVKRSPLFVEHGMHYFIARAGEVFELKLQPQSGHRIKGHWVVRDARTGAVIA